MTTIRNLQDDLAARWGTQDYNDAFKARVAAGDPLARVDHDFKHLLKSLGQLAGIAEECDHASPVDRAGAARAEAEKKLADTLIVLLGLANHWPGGAIDAQRVVAARVAAKFPPREAPRCNECGSTDHGAACCDVEG